MLYANSFVHFSTTVNRDECIEMLDCAFINQQNRLMEAVIMVERCYASEENQKEVEKMNELVAFIVGQTSKTNKLDHLQWTSNLVKAGRRDRASYPAFSARHSISFPWWSLLICADIRLVASILEIWRGRDDVCQQGTEKRLILGISFYLKTYILPLLQSSFNQLMIFSGYFECNG